MVNLLPNWILNSKNYYLVVVDMDGNYSFINEAFKNRFSFAKYDLIGKSSMGLIHPQDYQKCVDATNHILQNPNEIVEIQIRKPSGMVGEYFWTNWEFSVLKDENDQLVGVLCIGNDITESMMLSKKAKDYEHKAETIIENISDGFMILNRDWQFIKINSAGEKLLKRNRDELLGKEFWSIIPNMDYYQFPKLLRWAMETGESINFEEQTFNSKAIFNVVVYPSPEGLTIFFRDVTKERNIEKNLIYSESKLRALLDSTSDSNVLISPDFKVLSFNKQASITYFQLFHKYISEGDDFRDYIFKDNEEDFHHAFEQALCGEVVKIEKEIQIEHKVFVWFHISYFPVYDHENRLMGVSFDTINVDQRKRMELHLQHNIEMLKSISWQQSHEVRKPVANILGLVSLLQEAEDDSERSIYLKHLEDSTNELDDIIHEIVHKISAYYHDEKIYSA